MKRMFMIAVALFAAFSLSAQEPGKFRLVRPDSTLSLIHISEPTRPY